MTSTENKALCFLCQEPLLHKDRLILMVPEGYAEVVDEHSVLLAKIEGELPDGKAVAHIECMIKHIDMGGMYSTTMRSAESFD